MLDRYGPWAVITGASEGTGREFARQLAAAGISLLLVARRQAALDALAEELKSEFGVDARTASIDLSLPDAGTQIAQAAEGLEIGLYIANAGADPHSSKFLDLDIATWRDLTQRNAVTTMECCHHFGRAMRERGRGGIILVNSFACYNGADFMAIYSASKAFQLCLGDALWSELKPHGVDVLSLVLSRTDTPEFRRMLTDKGFPVSADLAPSEEVARAGLANLANGPVFNWGQDRDGPQLAPMSSDDRRKRVEMISAASKPFFEA
jgi:short-subunit dehydrogenase